MPIADPIIAIDEAATLADPNDTHLVVAGLVSGRSDREVDRIIKRERRRLEAAKGKAARASLSEIKFKSASDRTRRRILGRLCEANVEIVVCAVEKRGAVPDVPENYARLVWGVLAECLRRYPSAATVVDAHFNLTERRRAFDQAISSLAGAISSLAGWAIGIEHGDSAANPRLGLADFLAGAMLKEARHGDATYADIVRERIVAFRREVWRKEPR